MLHALGRNVWLFFLAQGLSMTTININIIIVGLAGLMIAPEPWLATLPLSVQFIASMLTTLPASLAMGRFGRKPVFITGVFFAALGMFGQGISLMAGKFIWFVVSAVFIGMAHGIAQFYRYAAADSVANEKKPVVVSLVLAGGLIAAVFGATIVKETIGLASTIYVGSFFAAGLLQILLLGVLLSLRMPAFVRPEASGRPLATFFRMPRFQTGLVGAALGYGVMTFLMTATPLQIVNVSKLGDAANATVIQWHVIAMFAPSFITGPLIRRFGVEKVMATGLLLYLVAVLFLINGSGFWNYFTVLLLVGLGWNTLYVGGSSIVAAVAEPDERPKVQGITDFIITFIVALASLSAGAMHYLIGWHAMGIAVLLPVGIIAGFIIMMILAEKRDARLA
ncbi:MFS transporter [Alphaproteobacteria bacterium LSUCC0684]